MSPKLTSVTCWPLRTSPVTNSRVYVQTPPRVSAVTKMCMFQFLNRQRCLRLNVAITFMGKHGGVVVVRALPGHFVWRCSKGLCVKRASRIREHGHRLAYPDTFCF